MMTLTQLETEFFALPFQDRAFLAQRFLENIASEYAQRAKQLQALIAQGDADIAAGRVTAFISAEDLANSIRGQ